MLIHLFVKGRVQGVGFRAFVQKKATQLGLSGWVRNRINGAVELMLDGAPEKVEIFLKECRRGPYFARVDALQPVSIPDAPIPPIEQGICHILATV